MRKTGFIEKTKDRTQEEDEQGFMSLFVEFGTMKNGSPDSDKAQLQVKKIQDYITEHLYTCTDTILASLGKMYAGGGELTDNIDNSCGNGTTAFVAKAIEYYCTKRKE